MDVKDIVLLEQPAGRGAERGSETRRVGSKHGALDDVDAIVELCGMLAAAFPLIGREDLHFVPATKLGARHGFKHGRGTATLASDSGNDVQNSQIQFLSTVLANFQRRLPVSIERGRNRRQEPISKAMVSIFGFESTLPRFAKSPAEFVVIEQSNDCANQILATVRVDAVAGFAVTDHFGTGIDVGRDTGFSVSHSFQINQSEAFASAGHGENSTTCVSGIQRFSGQKTGKQDSLGGLGLSGFLLQAFDIVAGPGDDELSGRAASHHVGEGVNQLVVTFVLLAGVHPSDNQNGTSAQRSYDSVRVRKFQLRQVGIVPTVGLETEFARLHLDAGKLAHQPLRGEIGVRKSHSRGHERRSSPPRKIAVEFDSVAKKHISGRRRSQQISDHRNMQVINKNEIRPPDQRLFENVCDKSPATAAASSLQVAHTFHGVFGQSAGGIREENRSNLQWNAGTIPIAEGFHNSSVNGRNAAAANFCAKQAQHDPQRPLRNRRSRRFFHFVIDRWGPEVAASGAPLPRATIRLEGDVSVEILHVDHASATT